MGIVNKNILSLLFVIVFYIVTNTNASGQAVPIMEDNIARSGITPERVFIDYKNNWLSTSNPVAIGIITMPDMGKAQFDAYYIGGEYHRAAQSGSIGSLGFSADSYKALKKINLYGKFNYLQQRHKSRGWCDGSDPYNGSPYIAGSDLKGKYSRQTFDFDIKASSLKLFEFIWIGSGMRYNISDFSRLQDPRSRVMSIDLEFTPGFVFMLNDQNKIGLNGIYRFKKEKYEDYVSKSQDSKEYRIYRQEGVGVYNTIISTYFNRRIKGNYFGGEIQYEYNRPKFSLISQAGITSRADAIEDNSRSVPGDYSNIVADLSISGRLKGEYSLNVFSVIGNFMIGNANKAYQEVVTVEDPNSGVITSYYHTLFTVHSYRNTAINAAIDWKYYKIKSDCYKWYTGLHADYFNFENRYLYFSPNSYHNSSSANILMHCGGIILDKPKYSLDINFKGGYLFNINRSLSISDEQTDKTIVNNVTIPDYELLGRNCINYEVNLNFIFSTSAKSALRWFLSPFYNHYISNSSIHRYAIGISVGILTGK